MFKVKLSMPEPEGVKLNKKKLCMVTLIKSVEEDRMATMTACYGDSMCEAK